MTERPPVRPAQYRRVYIETDSGLADVLPELMQADAVGVDIEMGQRVRRKPGGVQEWYHILALVQIAGNGISVVLDPLRCSVDPLRPLMSGDVRKVFLGGGQDALMLERSGIEPLHVADVGEVALSLFGRREDGMAALAQRIFGLSLDKTMRRTDWMVRPLNQTLIAYAHQDAELTLDIYRWFVAEHPETLRAHERLRLEPSLPPGTPEWLRHITSRSSMEGAELLSAHGLERERDEQVLVDAIRAPLHAQESPRQVNRLLRAIGELRLTPLLDDVLPLLASHSSLVRASAARTVGKIAEPEQAERALRSLLEDAMMDVRKAAEAAIKEASKPRRAEVAQVDDDPDEEAVLTEEARTALAALKAQLEDSAGT